MVRARVGLEVGAKAPLHLRVVGKVAPHGAPGVDDQLGHLALGFKHQVGAGFNVHRGGALQSLMVCRRRDTSGHVEGAMLV